MRKREQVVKKHRKTINQESMTRKSSREKKIKIANDNVEICGVCTEGWKQEIEEEELWLDCSVCDGWFHSHCVGLADKTSQDLSSYIYYICDLCK